eukprot:CAMPEP_0179702270 /NCGR_PEP_ID=MMETSP0937-20121108/2189_1 /TAXON_ID=548131 ORGANISM="Ostreococcus mediterraneus, Strain clade-D-RCC2593" /NCGR_SAMPLE_ID=MMETSP0937 /ASSEMBLY_ACC=CAM_ASM_000575 /LENGTH=36 /DNA_ID= /DNA_START= /DNA_END= /DNA_ORIENTATION=
MSRQCSLACLNPTLVASAVVAAPSKSAKGASTNARS